MVIAKTYSVDSVTKHRTKLRPVKQNLNESPELVPLQDYAHFNSQKNPIDYEDEKMFKPRAGFSITSKEDFFPE